MLGIKIQLGQFHALNGSKRSVDCVEVRNCQSPARLRSGRPTNSIMHRVGVQYQMIAHPYWGSGFPSAFKCDTPSHRSYHGLSTMDSNSQRPKGRDDTLSKLNDAIGDLNRAEEVSNITPAKVVFGSTSALLPTIRVSSLLTRV